MQAGLIKRLMTIEDIANLVKDTAPRKRGSYKKKDKWKYCGKQAAFFISILHKLKWQTSIKQGIQ